MKTRSITNSIAFLLITFVTLIFQFRHLNEIPAYTHTWAQNDRLALANGFVRNDLNFFKPQNYILNHQFPKNWSDPSYSTITAVEFPVHDYVPAVFMEAFGTNEPWVFHAYILIYSIVGFFFLYLLSEKICGSKIKAALVVIFAMSSPIYIFYQGGFLPTIPSIANTIIALYCYALYFEGGRKKWFRWALFFFTFAALARFTFVIPYLAVLGFELIRIFQKKAKFWPNVLGVGLSALVILAAQYYNSTLRATYGSDFLSQLLPADNWAEMKTILEHIWEVMVLAYLSMKHYFLLFLLIVLVLIALLIKERNTYRVFNAWWIICLFWFTGVVLFWFAMAKQFFAHDYYFLDTFYLPVVFFVALCLAVLPKPQWYFGETVMALFVIYFGMISFRETSDFQDQRRVFVASDHFTGSVMNFEGSDEFLTKSGVAREDTILVIHTYGPNIPFIFMNRVGLAVVGHEPDDINRALSWKWDYVVFQKPYFMDEVYAIYPEILEKVESIATNENLILCKRKTDTIPQSMMDFMGVKGAYKTIRTDFETINKAQPGILYEKDPADAKNQVGVVGENEAYGFAQDFTKDVGPDTQGRVLKIKGKFLRKNDNQIAIIVAYSRGNDLNYYQTVELNPVLPVNEWTEKEFILFLPKRSAADEKLSFYIHNTNKNVVLLDDFEFTFYRN
ncbi:glycosyltransferase family 39 protein [Fluviicola sp.]|uniref:glycosyltransferase family 39 protein n=1 Tax=Fluviicola sp. TaxID=1917219 RepID=UPI0031D02752